MIYKLIISWEINLDEYTSYLFLTGGQFAYYLVEEWGNYENYGITVLRKINY